LEHFHIFKVLEKARGRSGYAFITQRSEVQILPPQSTNQQLRNEKGGFEAAFSHESAGFVLVLFPD
jgi:hypothetical protein